MNDTVKATLVGDPVDSPLAPPKTRAERVLDWRKENSTAYRKAQDACCVCTPTRAQALLVEQWDNPPID